MRKIIIRSSKAVALQEAIKAYLGCTDEREAFEIEKTLIDLLSYKRDRSFLLELNETDDSHLHTALTHPFPGSNDLKKGVEKRAALLRLFFSHLNPTELENLFKCFNGKGMPALQLVLYQNNLVSIEVYFGVMMGTVQCLKDKKSKWDAEFIANLLMVENVKGASPLNVILASKSAGVLERYFGAFEFVRIQHFSDKSQAAISNKVKIMLQAPDQKRRTPLFLAAASGDQRLFIELCKIMQNYLNPREFNAELERTSYSRHRRQKYGHNILHEASASGNALLVEHIMELISLHFRSITGPRVLERLANDRDASGVPKGKAVDDAVEALLEPYRRSENKRMKPKVETSKSITLPTLSVSTALPPAVEEETLLEPVSDSLPLENRALSPISLASPVSMISGGSPFLGGMRFAKGPGSPLSAFRDRTSTRTLLPATSLSPVLSPVNRANSLGSDSWDPGFSSTVAQVITTRVEELRPEVPNEQPLDVNEFPPPCFLGLSQTALDSSMEEARRTFMQAMGSASGWGNAPFLAQVFLPFAGSPLPSPWPAYNPCGFFQVPPSNQGAGLPSPDDLSFFVRQTSRG